MKKDWMVRESELDDPQLNVLYAGLDKSHVVSGCAGSGKSILALMMARRIRKESGDRCEIIVYTRALSRYMDLGKREMGISVPIFVHNQWKKTKPSVAYVIVDEVQDFTREEILEFVYAAKKQFVFFGDTAQSIYDPFKEGTVRVEDIGKEAMPISKEMKKETLYYNYRLPISVAKFVQHVGVGLPEFDEDKYKNPVDAIPYILCCDNIQEQLVTIKQIINRDNLDDVAILLPTNDEVKLVRRYLEKLDVPHEVKYNVKRNGIVVDWEDNLNFNTTNPKVTTYHSAKGLQFETVFVPCVSSFYASSITDCNALYVAMTRTYRDLYVMYSGSMPEVLKNIPSELYKNSVDKDTIDDI